ncbi:MAG: PfkB family carbohydrate kinase [Cellulophaga sp.]|nr:PfkB family carbohydrate kinase [Cellulophaga sp.]
MALRLQSYGVVVAMISSVGADKEGSKIINYLKDSGVNTDLIQSNGAYSTGQVNVILNDKGIASYDIKYPVAWDKIEFRALHNNQLLAADIFVFGSLACRDKTSQNTLLRLLKLAKYKVFDVNLRFPHYTKELLINLLNQSNFVKFNDDELFEIGGYLNSKYNSMEQTISFIAKETNTESICVTKGAYGAVLYHKEKFYYNSGYRIKVLDTVGSGDSFLASVIFKLFNGKDPQSAIDFGCAVGAMVAKSEGANPIFTNLKIAKFMNP